MELVQSYTRTIDTINPLPILNVSDHTWNKAWKCKGLLVEDIFIHTFEVAIDIGYIRRCGQP